jgi:HD-like signal output (HDOD) protein
MSYLGVRNVVRIVVTSCASSFFSTASGSAWCDGGVIWRHAIGCALTCQAIARRCPEIDEGTAFTAGILHDAGKVAMAQLLAAQETLWPHRPPAGEDELPGWERALFGTDHATLGALVAQRWGMGTALTRAVENHHVEDRIGADGPMTAMLHIADLVCLTAGLGSPPAGLDVAISPVALGRLGLTAGDIGRLRSGMLVELARSRELVNML